MFVKFFDSPTRTFLLHLLLLVYICSNAFQLVQSLQPKNRRQKPLPKNPDNVLPETVISDLASRQETPLLGSSSYGLVNTQEGDAARRILKRRSTRGKNKLASKDRTTAGRQGRRKPTPPTDKTLAPAKKPVRRAPTKERDTQVDANKQPTGFIFGPPARGIDLRYEWTFEALRVYHEKHSNLIMPRKYLVPEDDEYPQRWHGIDLAGTVYDMKWWLKHVKQKPARVAELNKLGFVWERLQPEWNLVLEALITYGTLHGDLLVPAKFVIPYDDERWPRATLGVPLGNSVYRIRNRGDFLRGNNAGSRRDQLDSLGFVWDTRELRFQTYCSALRRFAQIEASKDDGKRTSALKIPSQFVVPQSTVWPKELWGYQLGAKCTAVRQKELYIKGHAERLRILADIGFHFGGNDGLSWLEVVHAAAVYSQMNNRQLDVPSSFVVPAPPRLVSDGEDAPTSFVVVGSDEAWPWPEYLWGFPLGQRLRDVRLKGYYLKGKKKDARRRQLDTLGFVWTPKRGRPRRMK